MQLVQTEIFIVIIDQNSWEKFRKFLKSQLWSILRKILLDLMNPKTE